MTYTLRFLRAGGHHQPPARYVNQRFLIGTGEIAGIVLTGMTGLPAREKFS